MAERAAMHHAGATSLSQWLQFSIPAADYRSIPCRCGHRAGYQELRSQPVRTAVGEVTISRPYYCARTATVDNSPPMWSWTLKTQNSPQGVRAPQASRGRPGRLV